MTAITSPANHKRLDELRKIAVRLCKAKDDEEKARELIEKGKPIIWIAAGLHSTEVIAGQNTSEAAQPWQRREPAGRAVDLRDRRHRSLLVGADLDPAAQVSGHAQQVVDDVETLRARRPVDAAQIDQAGEGAVRIVAQARQHRDDRRPVDREAQFAVHDLRLDRVPHRIRGQDGKDVHLQFVERFRDHRLPGFVGLPGKARRAADFLLELQDPI